MRKLNLIIAIALFPLFLGSCQSKYPSLANGLYAEFTTNHGTFVTKLYEKATPMTVASFVSLAEGNNPRVSEEYKGKKFYDGLIFHRVIKDFMIQGGDPKGTGSGGPGYSYPDEIVDTLTFNRKGLLAMANSGPATNGSQFFVTLAETPWLNGNHTIFGEVVMGQEVVDAIGEVQTSKPGDKPVKDVVIQKVTIIKKGKVNVPDFSKALEEKEKEEKEKEAAREKIAEEKSKELEEVRAKAESRDSGIKIYYHKKGDGTKPNVGDRVGINYAGYLANGQLFDSNRVEVAERYGVLDPKRLAANLYIPLTTIYSLDAQMIPGFKEAMMEMKIGDQVTVFIPSHLAYGSRGISGVIPPNSELIFEMEIVE